MPPGIGYPAGVGRIGQDALANSGLFEALGGTAPPTTTRDKVKKFTGDLLFTLGQSLTAAASAPGQRGTLAGIGAAFQAPGQLAEIERQREEEAKENFIQRLIQQSEMKKREQDIIESQARVGNMGVSEVNGSLIRRDPLTGEVRTFAQVPDIQNMTPEQGFIQSAMQEAVAQNGGQPLSPGMERQVRYKARVDWAGVGGEAGDMSLEERFTALKIAEAEMILPDGAKLSPAQEAQIVLEAQREWKSISEDVSGEKLDRAIQLSGQLKTHALYISMLNVENSVIGVQEGLGRQSGFGDIAAINNFQRMLDEGVVRGEDVALIQSASSLVAQYSSEFWLAQLRSGDRLPQPVRDEMRQLAEQLYRRKSGVFNETVGRQYKELADAAGVPHRMVGTLEFGGALGERVVVDRLTNPTTGEEFLEYEDGTLERVR